MSDLGTRLRSCRESAGISLVSLAESLGIHRNTLANWEASRSQPTLDEAFRLAEALGCTVQDFHTKGPRFPRYIVWGKYDSRHCDTLAEALDCKRDHGGTIYEPLGMSTAEYLCREEMLLFACEAMVAALAITSHYRREEALTVAVKLAEEAIAATKKRHEEFARLADGADATEETPSS